MRVTAVSTKSYPARAKRNAPGISRPVSNTINPPVPSNPSFGIKVIQLPGARMEELKTIWQDGPELYQIAKETFPKLEQNFGRFFDISLNFFVDLERTISLNARSTGDKSEALRKHIINYNDTAFHFPEKVITDLKNKKDIDWLNYEHFNPFQISFDKYGYVRSRYKLLDFADKESNNTLIKKLYQTCPPYKTPGDVIPEYHYSCPGW